MRHLKFQQNFPGGPEAMGGGGLGPPHLIRSYRLQGHHHAPVVTNFWNTVNFVDFSVIHVSQGV